MKKSTPRRNRIFCELSENDLSELGKLAGVLGRSRPSVVREVVEWFLSLSPKEQAEILAARIKRIAE